MLGRIHLFCEVWAKYIQHTFFILLLTVTSQIAAAEPVDLVRAAPFKDLASSQELKEGYVNLSTKPYAREDLAISLLIPKDWRDIPIKFPAEMLQKATEIFIPLTEQRAPRQEAGNALIEVRYSKLDMEADLSDLVDAFLESFGYEVLMRRQGEYSQRKVDELLVRSVQENVNYLVRLTFSRHGDRVFLVNGSVQESYIDQYAKILGTAAVSLKVKQKSTSEFAQPMTKFSSKGKPKISIRYPTPYWSLEELEEPPAGVTAVSLSLRAKGETSEEARTYAMIYVEAAEKNAKTPPDQVFKNLKDVFVESGFTFNKKILLADIEPRLNAPLGKLERWDVTVGGLPAEAALLLLPNGNSYLSLGPLDAEIEPWWQPDGTGGGETYWPVYWAESIRRTTTQCSGS